MPKTVPYGTVFFRHKPDEVDTRLLDREMMLHEVVHDRTLHRPSLRDRESIEWMTVRLIISISYFDKYPYISFSRDDIDLTSWNRIVRLYDRIALLLEISQCGDLSMISLHSSGFMCYFLHSRNYKTSLKNAVMHEKALAVMSSISNLTFSTPLTVKI